MAGPNDPGTMRPVLQVIGLTSASFLTGKLFSQSWSAIPALLHAPAPLLAKQWRAMFHSDIYLAPLTTVLSSGIFAYLAAKFPKTSKPQLLYATAAALLLSLVPYSAIWLEPINRMLEQRARTLLQQQRQSIDNFDALEKGLGQGIQASPVELEAPDVDAAWEKQSVHVLVDSWATINAGRVALAGLAAGLAGYATALPV